MLLIDVSRHRGHGVYHAQAKRQLNSNEWCCCAVANVLISIDKRMRHVALARSILQVAFLTATESSRAMVEASPMVEILTFRMIVDLP